ncbi:hypothetical protein SDC9_183454 [bioreactor metagenome]|uniref:Uncharacterized protein n=1 Tax=bioreactor metagenome TaxID=1076179 RepID=A0A645HCV0_9ZZZZ
MRGTCAGMRVFVQAGRVGDAVFRAGLPGDGAARVLAKPGVDAPFVHIRRHFVYAGVPERRAAYGNPLALSGPVR